MVSPFQPSFSMPSSAIQVLTVAELLGLIFQPLDRDSNTSNALVCKQWSDIALDVLWYAVEDVVPLFKILAPLDAIDDSEDYGFTRRLELGDWGRFDRYRFRVKCLSYQPSKDKVLEDDVFNEIARTRTSLFIFPNLHTLKWLDGSNLELCTIFMHENVKRFTLKVSNDDDYGYFFRDIALRMPHITHFDLRPEDCSAEIESEIIRLLPLLTHLKELTLPPRYLTTGIAEAVAYNQKLESISMGLNAYIGPHDALIPWLGEGAYPSLSKLAICQKFSNASTLLPNLPTIPTVLHIMSEINESPVDIAHLIALIVKNCQPLQLLSLTRDQDLNGLAPDYEEEMSININHLRPLFQLGHLVHCEIIHAYPLLLQLADIEEIAMSMPNVETLILNNTPHSSKPKLTLDALFPFARHCHRLHVLGLFINAKVDHCQYVSNPNFDSPVFRELRCLSVGYSLVEDECRVAWFLSTICPIGCTIESDEGDGYATESHETWQSAVKILSLLMKVRAEEKERVGLSLSKT